MKPKLLIIDKHQFGYLTDVYKWCEVLREDYAITVLSADVGEKKVELDGVRVIYVPFNMPRAIRGRLFVFMALVLCALNKGMTLVEYFPHCSILAKLFPKKKIVVDVRTLSVSPDVHHREGYNKILKRECSCFKYVMAISSGVACQIELDNIHILPLGSDVLSTHPKDYSGRIKLLYVGTLRWRRIEDTILGLANFLKMYPNQEIMYDIVGDGEPGQLESLKRLAKERGISGTINFHGWVPVDKLKPFFDEANVGLCYVPMTEHYDHQPPTKTFEYCNSGIYCIATGTSANKELITEKNGVIIPDSPEGVCDGLQEFIAKRELLCEKNIRTSLQDYNWRNIVKKNLQPFLMSI